MDSETQELKCIAPSGCWFTRYQKTGGNQQVDKSCPPRATMMNTINGINNLQNIFSGVTPEAPGMSELEAETRAPDESPAMKTCAYAAQGETLEGSCLFYTPDPIDTLSVVWHIPTGQNGQNFGVALKTQYPKYEASSVARQLDITPAEGETLAGSISRRMGSWFDMSTAGGGMGYVRKDSLQRLHYGDVNLQVIRSNYQFMTPEGNSTQLVPSYLNIAEVAPLLRPDPDPNPEPNPRPRPHPRHPPQDSPGSTNVCYDASGTPNNKCYDSMNGGGACRALKLAPASLGVTETRYVVQPWDYLLGLLSGIVGTIIIVLKLFHRVVVKFCAASFPTCCGEVSTLGARTLALALDPPTQATPTPSQPDRWWTRTSGSSRPRA